MSEQRSPTTYVLNSPVLTAYGRYSFEGPIAVGHARKLLEAGFVSAVGHPGTASFLSSILGLDVPCDRRIIAMQAGDAALVLRLHARLPEGSVLTREQMNSLPFELGVLRRES